MWDLFQKGGPLMWPILGCSVAAMAASIAKLWQYAQLSRQLLADPAELATKPPAVLAELYAATRQGCEERLGLAEAEVVRRLEAGLGLLSAITTMAPLLGLTGTVTGMIEAFQTISTQTGRVAPVLLAGGIWEALLTTAAGLLVAIPTFAVHYLLEARLDVLLARCKAIGLEWKKVGHGA